MATDSSTSGPLAPSASPPSDAPLADALQAVIRDVSGVPGEMVRPRWEPEGAQIPEPGETWIAFGINNITRDPYPTLSHEDDGSTESTASRRTLEYDVLVSCYGPFGMSVATRLADGLQIRQNIQPWADIDLAFVEATEIQAVPSLFKQRWWQRYDMRLRLRHLTTSTYPIRTIASATATLDNEFYSTPLTAP